MLRFSQIMVPLDGSELAAQALPVAARLLEPGGTLHLVMVLDLSAQLVGFDVAVAAAASSVSATASMASYLAEAAATVRGPGVTVQTSVREGAVAPTLCSWAAETKADLIVMTTHGRGGFSRFWLGSVADRVVHSTETPVLCLKPEAPLAELALVLVPLDGSEVAEAAIGMGLAVAGRLGVGVEFVRVVDPTTMVFMGPPGVPLAVTQEEFVARKLAAQRYLSGIRQQHSGGLPAAAAVVLTAANAGNAISDHARERGPAMVVMAAHRAGKVERALLGSVTDKVLRSDTPAVLVIRQPATNPGVNP